MPQQARSATMVQSILDGAARVLAKHGMAGYHTTSIAEETGASIGSVYQYFPNRDAVTSALILRAHQELLVGLRRSIERTQDLPLEQALADLIETAIPSSPDALSLMRWLELEEERLPRSAEVLRLEAEIESLNASFLRRYLSPERVADETLETISFDVVSIIRGMIDASLARRGRGGEGLPQRISRAVLGYLRPLLQPQ